MRRLTFVVAALAALAADTNASRAQVAFVPIVGSFPNGVSLGVTPVVSLDRRYVRMSISPQFTALEGFDTAPVPAAVSGGGGGLGGGGGGAGAFRSMGVPGPTFTAGMDGVIGQGGYGEAPGQAYNPDASTLLAGVAGFASGPRLTQGGREGASRKVVRRPVRGANKKRGRPR